MAIVTDLSGNWPVSMPTGIDQRLASPNRDNGASPLGSLIPLYAGEIVRDTTTGNLWFANAGLTTTSWVPYVVIGA